MIRRFVDLDGSVLEETEWNLTPVHTCFYCRQPLITCQNAPCPSGLAQLHDFVTLCSPPRDRYER